MTPADSPGTTVSAGIVFGLAGAPASGECPLCAAARRGAQANQAADTAAKARGGDGALGGALGDDPTGASDDPALGSSDDDRSCRCHDQGRDMVRDGASVLHLPEFVSQAQPISLELPEAWHCPVQRDPRMSLAPRPPTALLRLHTLLLT